MKVSLKKMTFILNNLNLSLGELHLRVSYILYMGSVGELSYCPHHVVPIQNLKGRVVCLQPFSVRGVWIIYVQENLEFLKGVFENLWIPQHL